MPRQLLAASSLQRLHTAARHFIVPLAGETARKAYYLTHPGSNESLEEQQRAGIEADFWGSVAATVLFSLNTAYWYFAEKEVLDFNCRDAVAAELGVENPGIRDYLNSNNIIAQTEAWDLLKFGAIRLLTNAAQVLFSELPRRAWALYSKEDVPGPMVDGDFNLTYAATAAYWFVETFSPKSPMYDLYTMQEKMKMGGDVTFNEVFLIMQRTREAAKLPLLDDVAKERLRPVVEYLVELCNTPHTDLDEQGQPRRPVVIDPQGKEVRLAERFATPHLVYLIGCQRLSVFDEKGKLMPPEAVLEACLPEVNRVATLGLEEIKKRNANRFAGKEGPAHSDCADNAQCDAHTPRPEQRDVPRHKPGATGMQTHAEETEHQTSVTFQAPVQTVAATVDEKHALEKLRTASLKPAKIYGDDDMLQGRFVEGHRHSGALVSTP